MSGDQCRSECLALLTLHEPTRISVLTRLQAMEVSKVSPTERGTVRTRDQNFSPLKMAGKSAKGVFSWGVENFWVSHQMCWKDVGRDFWILIKK